MPQSHVIIPPVSVPAALQLSHGSIAAARPDRAACAVNALVAIAAHLPEEFSFVAMDSLLAFAAPLALMLPLVAEGADVPKAAPASTIEPSAAGSAVQVEAAAATSEEPPLVNPLSALRASATARQVRIEQRVVVRIAPAAPAARQNMLAELPQRALPSRFEETRKEKCVPLDRIAGVQTGSGNRLVLFLRDQRMISVNLEKSCHARDFYSGFYVEKNKDGRLCAERDKLHSRTGVRCDVEVMRHLVAADN